MLAEMLKFLDAQSKQAALLQVLPIAENDGVARVVSRDGEIEVLTKAAPHRVIEMLTLSDLVALASKPFDAKWARRAIFYDADAVTLVLDWENGYELATLNLIKSKEWNFFATRRESPTIQVPDLVHALLTTLRRCRGDEPNAMDGLIAAVGSLKTAISNRSDVSADRSRVGIAKGVIEEVDGGKEKLPEDIQSFKVRPFAVRDIGQRFDLSCTLLPKVSEGKWLLEPLEDSWLAMERDMLDDLRGAMDPADKAGVAIYCGSWDTSRSE